jgi:hypothetical protein
MARMLAPVIADPVFTFAGLLVEMHSGTENSFRVI